MVLVSRLLIALLDHQLVTLHLSPVRYRPKSRRPRNGISPHVPRNRLDLNKIRDTCEQDCAPKFIIAVMKTSLFDTVYIYISIYIYMHRLVELVTL
jgi:hypothetical protein